MSFRVEVDWDRPTSVGESEHWLSVTLSGLPSPDAPMSFAVLVDTSTSMLGDRLAQARAAVAAICAGCRPNDRLAVFSFASDVRQVVVASGGDDVTGALGQLEAGGKTRLDLALDAADTWLDGRAGTRRLLLLTDGDPTSAEGRRVDVAPFVERARGLGARGVRTTVIGLGSVESYDSGFLRSFADAGGGPSFVGVPPQELVERALGALRAGSDEASEVELRLASNELALLEAWRVVPRVQPLSAGVEGASLSAAERGVVLLRLRLVSELASRLGSKLVGELQVRVSGGQSLTIPLHLRIVSPSSSDRNALNAEVDGLRVRVELARTAQLRAASNDSDDQLRLTRRLADLVGQVHDPRATARISTELHRLTSGGQLDRGERERTVEELRGGLADG